MASQWIWAQMSASVPGRAPAFNPPLVEFTDSNGIGYTIIKLGAVPDPNTGASLNQYCLCCVDSSMAGAAWADLPPLDQAICLYAADQHPDDLDLAAAIPVGAVSPALSPADAAAFANAQVWLNYVNATPTWAALVAAVTAGYLTSDQAATIAQNTGLASSTTGA